MRSRAGVGAAVALVGIGAALVPATAASAGRHHHHVARPAAPSGLRVVAATPSSFTVAVHPAAHAHRYRLYASTTRSDLFVKNISHAHASGVTRSTRMTIGNLPFTAAPYYYRVEALNQKRWHFSTAIGDAGLKPARPSGLAVASSRARTSVTWNSGAATGFRVECASNPAMTAHRRNYRILGSLHQYTPFGLHRGHTYYFRVQALNDRTRSAPTPVVGVVDRDPQQAVRVMTYNVKEAHLDGQREGSGRVAPWSKRKPAAAHLISTAHPDVVGVQEAATLMTQRHGGVRQIDTLRSALHGSYGLAHTEQTPRQRHTRRTGNYILFRKATFRAVGRGGHWGLGSRRTAAWQVLKNRRSGAKFLFVSAHLLDARGRANDVAREREASVLVNKGHRLASHRHMPVVYVGDFNSDQYNHAFNGPMKVMSAHGVADAYNAAQHRRYAHYNTANHYLRRPPHHDARIDYIFAPPGVAVRSWALKMRLHHGQFRGTIPSDHNPVISQLEIPY